MKKLPVRSHLVLRSAIPRVLRYMTSCQLTDPAKNNVSMPTRKGLFQSIIITIESNHNLVLTSLLLFSGATWLMVAFWKYGLFLYNALDLAIYSQVFWNTSYGRWFEMSIHPQSYIGDHFEPLILLLTPIYSLWRDPRMLLILQTLAIQLAVIPIYLLARNIFQKNASIKTPRALALVIA